MLDDVVDLYESVIDANRVENSTKRMLKLKKLLHELPEHNFETFHFLAQHLSRVASHEEVNKVGWLFTALCAARLFSFSVVVFILNYLLIFKCNRLHGIFCFNTEISIAC